MAHSVYDRFESRREPSVAPNRCLIRNAELTGEKPPKALHLDASKKGLLAKDDSYLVSNTASNSTLGSMNIEGPYSWTRRELSTSDL